VHCTVSSFRIGSFAREPERFADGSSHLLRSANAAN
jgi:hypothetical protein